jgi:hypothetical protein
MHAARGSLMPGHCYIDTRRNGLRIRLLRQLVSTLVSNQAAPTITANLNDTAIKLKAGDIIHLDAPFAMPLPTMLADTPIRLLLNSDRKPAAAACRRSNLRIQHQRMQS